MEYFFVGQINDGTEESHSSNELVSTNDYIVWILDILHVHIYNVIVYFDFCLLNYSISSIFRLEYDT